MIEENNIQTTYSLCYEDKFSNEDIEYRHLFLNCGVDNDIIESIVYHILRYNMLDRDIPIEQRKPIYLYINSPGGDLVSCFSLIDAIIASKTPVFTVNIGECSSAGFLIFIAGAKRYTMPHSQFLLHDGETGAIDSMSKVKDKLEFDLNQLIPMMKQFVLDRTKIEKKHYERNFRAEWYFLADDAIKFGIADYIVGRDCGIEDIL